MSDLIGALAILLLGLAIVAFCWLAETVCHIAALYCRARAESARLVWRPSAKSIRRSRARARRRLV